MMTQLALAYRRLSSLWKTMLHAIVAAVVFFGGALLEQRIQNAIKDDIEHAIIRGLALLLLLIIFIAVFYALRTRIESLEEAESQKLRQLLYAASLMDQFVAGQIRSLSVDNWSTLPSQERARRLIASVDRLSDVVHAAYQLFESHFGSSERAEDRVDFEVTFMTKSLQDGKITIPAYANRVGRAPISMLKRAQNPDIYKNSITAQIYEAARPEMRIIEDTSQPNTSYTELYPGQRDRIQSTIVYPVLDEDNRLLGTLVVHCNRIRFFRESERAHWRELLEIFARRLALERVRIEIAVNQSFLWESFLTIEKPF